MTRYLSPLRYPGGKARLAPYVAALLSWQSDAVATYAEPFAGGAGIALRLLVDNAVKSVHINDLNPGIAAFWRCVFSGGEEFATKVESAEISIRQWHFWREVYLNPSEQNDLDLGFATFFLNRTNRSGILTARPIGGLEQRGDWKLDARFNRVALADRIRHLAQFTNRVEVTQLDAREMIMNLDPGSVDDYFLYVDPPYLVQGDGLYMNSLSMADHAALAEVLSGSRARWMLTYDADARVTRSLYASQRCFEFDIQHFAHRQHLGQEYAVFSDAVTLPEDAVVVSGLGRWIRKDQVERERTA